MYLDSEMIKHNPNREQIYDKKKPTIGYLKMSNKKDKDNDVISLDTLNDYSDPSNR